MSFKTDFKYLFDSTDSCILRDFDFKNPHYHNDLDMWVDIRQRHKVLRMIESNVHFELKQNSFNFSVVAYQNKLGDAVKIDIFWKISFRGVKIVDDMKMRESIVRIGDVNTLTPQTGNALGFVKEVLHTGLLRDEKYIYRESFYAVGYELLQDRFFSHQWLVKSAENIHQNKPFSFLALYARLMAYKDFWNYIGAKFCEKANNLFWR